MDETIYLAFMQEHERFYRSQMKRDPHDTNIKVWEGKAETARIFIAEFLEMQGLYSRRESL